MRVPESTRGSLFIEPLCGAVSKDAEFYSTKVSFTCNTESFTARGRKMKQSGFLDIMSESGNEDQILDVRFQVPVIFVTQIT